MALGLLSRAELPRWVAPLPDTVSHFCVYFADAPQSLREYRFRYDRTGVAFLDVYRHELGAARDCVCAIAQDIYFIPPEVLIAASVEALRRTGRGS